MVQIAQHKGQTGQLRPGIKTLAEERPFPIQTLFQNGPRRQGFAAPRKTSAPLTAPGRSEPFLTRGKGAPEIEISGARATERDASF